MLNIKTQLRKFPSLSNFENVFDDCAYIVWKNGFDRLWSTSCLWRGSVMWHWTAFAIPAMFSSFLVKVVFLFSLLSFALCMQSQSFDSWVESRIHGVMWIIWLLTFQSNFTFYELFDIRLHVWFGDLIWKLWEPELCSFPFQT